MSSGGNRWLQFSNNGGRGRSRDQIILISFFNFVKFPLLYHITSLLDVFNHSFWKLYVKTINDLDPGLNLPEFFTRARNRGEYGGTTVSGRIPTK